MRVTVSAIYIPETGESKTNQMRGLAKEAVTYEYLRNYLPGAHFSEELSSDKHEQRLLGFFLFIHRKPINVDFKNSSQDCKKTLQGILTLTSGRRQVLIHLSFEP